MLLSPSAFSRLRALRKILSRILCFRDIDELTFGAVVGFCLAGLAGAGCSLDVIKPDGTLLAAVESVIPDDVRMISL